MVRWLVTLAAVLGAIGVIIGAYAAHGLENSLAEQGLSKPEIIERLDQCEVAVRYHMLHVLALLVIGTMGSQVGTRPRLAAAVFLLLGIVLFSGGLYSMVFLGVLGHWAIVPSGGLCFIVGWLCLAASAWSGKPAA